MKFWSLLTFVSIFLLAHIYLSWMLPSEGTELMAAIYGLLIFPLIALTAFVVRLIKGRRPYLTLVGIYSIAAFALIFVHLSYGNVTRQFWPWNQIVPLVEENCQAQECDEGIEFVFPIIKQSVTVHGKAQDYIEIDYGKGRTGGFNWELEEIYVD